MAAASATPDDESGDAPGEERERDRSHDRRERKGDKPAEGRHDAGAADTGSLPFTGLGLAVIAGAGLLLLAAGTGLRRRAG